MTLNDVPLGLNLYHIRMSDDNGMFAALEPEVKVNHGGSVITIENIDFGEEEYIEFTDEPRRTSQDRTSVLTIMSQKTIRLTRARNRREV